MICQVSDELFIDRYVITCNYCNIASSRNIPCQENECAAWFAGRLPEGWFVGPLEVRVDRDEIILVGSLPMPSNLPVVDDPQVQAEVNRQAAVARISGFREDTRMPRMQLAEAGQMQWQRKVSWGARCGDVEVTFTNASVPVMTRLRFEDRQILDTLIDAGVARSRSEAMAWCVAQVGLNQGDWIDRLRGAISEMERIRAEGP